jgi:hypothetical protein
MTYESYCAGLDAICDRYGELPETQAGAEAMNTELEAFKDRNAGRVQHWPKPPSPAARRAHAAPSTTESVIAIANAVATALAGARGAGTTAAPAAQAAPARQATATPAPVPAPEPRAMSNRELARATVAGMDGAPAPFFSAARDPDQPRQPRPVSPFMRAFADA